MSDKTPNHARTPQGSSPSHFSAVDGAMNPKQLIQRKLINPVFGHFFGVQANQRPEFRNPGLTHRKWRNLRMLKPKFTDKLSQKSFVELVIPDHSTPFSSQPSVTFCNLQPKARDSILLNPSTKLFKLQSTIQCSTLFSVGRLVCSTPELQYNIICRRWEQL